jgi:hypothetical protein
MTSIRTTADIYESMGLIPRVEPVLTPVRESLTTEMYLLMSDYEFDAYIDAQNYGDEQ